MKTAGNSPMSRNSPISSQRSILNPEKLRLKDDLKCKQSLKSSKKSLFFQEFGLQQNSKERSQSKLSLISKKKMVFQKLSNINIFPAKQSRCQCKELWQSQQKFNSFVKRQLLQLKARDQQASQVIPTCNFKEVKRVISSQFQRLTAAQKSVQKRQLINKCLSLVFHALGEQDVDTPAKKSVSFSEMIRASKESLQRISQESLTQQNFTQRENFSMEYQKF